jgi:hypothetical protein
MRALFGFLSTLVLLPFLASGADSRCPLARGLGGERFRSAGGGYVTLSDGHVREVKGVTFYCAGCHDGMVASPAKVKMGSIRGSGLSRLGGHPVNVPLPAWKRGFRSSFALDSRLVLEDDQVTCVTCHGGSNPTCSYLSLDSKRLCQSCHPR